MIAAGNATSYSVGEVSGSSVYFAGGGGGAQYNNDSQCGDGGLGGGTAGKGNATPVAAASNTGGGGGGRGGTGTNQNGGTGGSGIVILRYGSGFSITYDAALSTAGNSGEITDGNEKYIIFTGGTGNVSWS